MSNDNVMVIRAAASSPSNPMSDKCVPIDICLAISLAICNVRRPTLRVIISFHSNLISDNDVTVLREAASSHNNSMSNKCAPFGMS